TIADELIHVSLVRCATLIIPRDVCPYAVTGRYCDFNASLCNGNCLVLAERTGKKTFGLDDVGHCDQLLREHDQRRHRIVTSDRLGITGKQCAGVGIEELPGNIMLAHDHHATPTP